MCILFVFYYELLNFFPCFFFQFILNFLYKVATGQMKEVDDLREEEVLEKLKAEKSLGNGLGSHANNGKKYVKFLYSSS